MVTIGRGVLDSSVHEFFEGLRTYDPARAGKVLAGDADFESPWEPKITGKAKVEEFLNGWLKDPKKRPSFSIRDVSGDGAVTRLKLSISGRFGQAPELVTMHLLCLQHVLHHIKVERDGATAGH